MKWFWINFVLALLIPILLIILLLTGHVHAQFPPENETGGIAVHPRDYIDLNLKTTPPQDGIFDLLPDQQHFYPMTDAEREWFETSFVKGCCDIGDAFSTDEFVEKIIDGKKHFFAVILDGYDHHPDVRRVILRPGTLIDVPKEVMNHMSDPKNPAPRNPTKHGIIFLYIYHENGELAGRSGRPLAPGGPYDEHMVALEQSQPLCYWPPEGN